MAAPYKVFLFVACCVAWSVSARAERTPPARLLRVASTSEVANVAAQGLNSLSGRNMTKFLDQIERIQEVIRVTWEVPRGGSKSQTDVQLEYFTASSPDAQALRERHDETTTGRHETKFRVPLGSPVTAWRVRLVQDGRILDEKSSGTWK